MTLSAPTIDIRERIPDEVIREAVERIVEEFAPLKVILFGSYAYGEPRAESDLDLLIVMETTLRENEQALKIRQRLQPMFAMDILVRTPQRLKERTEMGDWFLREIVARGVVLYERPDIRMD